MYRTSVNEIRFPEMGHNVKLISDIIPGFPCPSMSPVGPRSGGESMELGLYARIPGGYKTGPVRKRMYT